MCWLTLLLQITDLNAKLVICTSETSDRVQEAIQLSKEKVPGVQALSFGPAVGCLDLVDALRTCALDSEKAERPVQYTDKELKEKTCLVFWSSGTTGLPKGTAQSPIPKVIVVHELCDKLPSLQASATPILGLSTSWAG